MASKRKSDTDPHGTPPKTTKLASSSQRFRPEYNEKWPCLQQSKKGESYVFCATCNLDFTCRHGGKNDCFRHIKSARHVEFSSSMAGQSTLSNFMAKRPRQLETTRAEVALCEFLVEHNLPFAAADTLTKAVKMMCPDSKIAADMKCGRNKATVVVKEMSALHMHDLAERMRHQPYSIATDGSNDADKKQYPLVVRIKGAQGTVNSELLAIRVCEDASTGENIFKLMDNELSAQRIPWDNCISFGCDNANVMTGWKKGVISFVRGEAAGVHLAGCCLHLVHIGARKGAGCLCPIEDIILDIFYYFQKSVKRQNDFKQLQSLFDVEQRKVLKHVCTRWLSISRCLERLMSSWEPLRQFFYDEHKRRASTSASVSASASSAVTEEEDTSEKTTTYTAKKVEFISDFLRSPTNQLYGKFLQYTLKVYDKVLLNLQAEEPKIHVLRSSLCALLNDLFMRFLKPSAINGKAVEEILFKESCNQKEDEDLLIGAEAMQMILSADANHLRQKRIKEFYSSVRQYFHVTCEYLMKKLPLADPVLKHAVVVDPEAKMTAKASDLLYFLKRFPALMPEEETFDSLLEQFSQYQITDVSSCIKERVDLTWFEIQNKHSNFSGLCHVMYGIMTIPHSSAACERVFSTVRKNSTDQRASLQQDTLEALLVVKAKPGCFLDKDRQHSDDALEKLKSAYYNSLKQK